jgi:hypothetical protein
VRRGVSSGQILRRRLRTAPGGWIRAHRKMFDAKIILERTAPCIVVDAGKHGQDLPQTLQGSARVSLSPALRAGLLFCMRAMRAAQARRHHEPSRGTVPYNGARESNLQHVAQLNDSSEITHVPIHVHNAAVECRARLVQRITAVRLHPLPLDSIHDRMHLMRDATANDHSSYCLMCRHDDCL